MLSLFFNLFNFCAFHLFLLLKFARLDDEEDEESYKSLRERERRQLFLHDYHELYRNNTEFGDLILQQRLQMVHWIIEVSFL